MRPSIIESALAEPRPGWIRGFRMAEPIIVSYARGLLAEFPGVPEGIVDVIPVDLVVAAILAVAARGPEPGRPKVYQVASGVRNPLRYGRLVELSTDFFQRNPLYDDRGQPISVPEWSFPGRGRVQRQLRRADAVMTFVERLITALPIRGRQAQLAARIEDRHAMAKRALGYVELYGAYTETDARYRVDNLLELRDAGDAEDHDRFEFDPAVIDWDRYVLEIHLPSVLEHTRVRTKPGKSVVDKRPDRQRRAILSPDRHLAVFDLEHTLMSSNVVDTYAWLASRHLSPSRRARFVADLVRQGPSLLALDRRDRGDFLRSFYRRFEDAPIERLREDSWELFHRQLLTRSFPDGFARVRAHRAVGHRTLLITGALDFIIEPIRPLFDDIVCAEMDAARRAAHRAPDDPAAHRRGAGAAAGRLRGGPLAVAGGVRRLRGLGQRPGHARGGRVPRRRQPRVPALGHRPAPGLARRALGQGRGWLAPPAATGAIRRQGAQGGHGTVSTLLFERSLPRFAAARVVSSFGSGRGAGVGPLRLVEREAPAGAGRRLGARRPRAVGHLRLRPRHPRRAQLALLRGHRLLPLRARATRWSAPWPRTRWAPTARALAAGSRVVLQPVLGCAARGIEPPCPACQAGQVGNCGSVAFGHIRPGLQTGFCADTGGGWSTSGLVAHSSQLYAVPDVPQRRRRGDRRAGGLRGPRRARRADRRGRRRGGARRGDARSAGDRRAEPPGRRSGGARRRPSCSSGRATRTSSGSPASSAAPKRCPPTSWPRAVRRHSRSLSFGERRGSRRPCRAARTW